MTALGSGASRPGKTLRAGRGHPGKQSERPRPRGCYEDAPACGVARRTRVSTTRSRSETPSGRVSLGCHAAPSSRSRRPELQVTPPRAPGHAAPSSRSRQCHWGRRGPRSPGCGSASPGSLSGTRGRKRLPGGEQGTGSLHLTTAAVEFRVPGAGTARRGPDTRRDQGCVGPGRTDGGDGPQEQPCAHAGVNRLGAPLGGDCRP